MNIWNRASPSQLKTFTDCNKKWWYNKILGLDMPGSNATDLGDRIHKYIENYLQDKEQVDNYGDIVEPCIPFLSSIKTKNPQIEIQFTNDKMAVPVSGRIDLFWIEGRKGFVVDHKTTSDLKWALKPDVLINDPQAIIYSAYIFDTYDVDEVEFSLHYIMTKGKPKSSLVSVTYTRQSIVDGVSRINADLRSMHDTSKQIEKEVLKNTKACYKFGPCPYQDRCLKFTGNIFEEVAMAKIDWGDLGPGKKTDLTPGEIIVVPRTRNIYIGCRPVQLTYTMLESFAAPEIMAFCEKEKLPHYTVEPYNKGPRVVAGAVWYAVKNKERELPEHLVVDPASPLGSSFIALLHEDSLGAQLVINGVR